METHRWSRHIGHPAALSGCLKEGVPSLMNRHRWLLAFIPAASLAVAMLAPIPVASAQKTPCRPADYLAARTVSALKDYVTSSDSFSVKLGKALGLRGMNPNKIRYSTDP